MRYSRPDTQYIKNNYLRVIIRTNDNNVGKNGDEGNAPYR
jgi:hypothetical protein